MTARCLFITGFCQTGFAAAMVYGGALRGAGDTLMVMVMSLISIFTLRLGAVLIVGLWLRLGLAAIWVLARDRAVRPRDSDLRSLPQWRVEESMV